MIGNEDRTLETVHRILTAPAPDPSPDGPDPLTILMATNARLDALLRGIENLTHVMRSMDRALHCIAAAHSPELYDR